MKCHFVHHYQEGLVYEKLKLEPEPQDRPLEKLTFLIFRYSCSIWLWIVCERKKQDKVYFPWAA